MRSTSLFCSSHAHIESSFIVSDAMLCCCLPIVSGCHVERRLSFFLQVIHKAVLSNSARSTVSASESNVSDWSGTPLRKLQKMKSKDYSNSTRSSKRKLYQTDRLSVEEKFPRGDFL